DWTVRGLEETQKILDGFYQYIGDDTQAVMPPDRDFLAAISDDLNAPKALARLHELRAPATGMQQIEQKRVLKSSANLLGLLVGKRRQYLESHPKRLLVDEDKIKKLIEARKKARATRQFQAADNIRDELAAMGVVLKDGKDPKTGEPVTTWEVAR